MMGANHAATGAAAWIAVTSTAPFALGWHPVSSVGVMTGAVVCAGAALLPDADHHNGTFAHSLPPVSEWVSDAVETVAGGHRQGTHSFLGIAVFTALAWLAGLVTVETASFGTVYVGGGLLAEAEGLRDQARGAGVEGAGLGGVADERGQLLRGARAGQLFLRRHP